MWFNASHLSPAMMQALQRAPSLEEFAAPVSSAWNWVYTRNGHPGVLVNIARNPSLQIVRVVARDTWNLKHWEYEVGEARKHEGHGQEEIQTLEHVLQLVECVVLA